MAEVNLGPTQESVLPLSQPTADVEAVFLTLNQSVILKYARICSGIASSSESWVGITSQNSVVTIFSMDQTSGIILRISLIATYEDRLPKLTKFLEDNLGDVMTFLAFPKRHHRKIHSTNVLERFNKEAKRRTKVVGAFPSEGSVLRLLVPLAVDNQCQVAGSKIRFVGKSGTR